MFKLLLTSSIRFFLKERFYSIINVMGLALGVASAFMIAQYVNNELSYDDHHPDVASTYRVNQTNIWSPEGGMMGSSVLPLAEALKSEYAQITSSLRINTMGSRVIKADLRTFHDHEFRIYLSSTYSNGHNCADNFDSEWHKSSY